MILSKEQSMASKITKFFSNGKIRLQHNVLEYWIDLYFPKHEFVIGVDEKGHTDTDKRKEKWKKRKK